MILKAPTPDGTRVRVTFTLPASVWAGNIQVVVDATRDGSLAAPMLLNRHEASWQATLELDAGRRYRFRYLLDGREWLDDHWPDARLPNAAGGYDPVLDLGRSAPATLTT